MKDYSTVAVISRCYNEVHLFSTQRDKMGLDWTELTLLSAIQTQYSNAGREEWNNLFYIILVSCNNVTTRSTFGTLLYLASVCDACMKEILYKTTSRKNPKPAARTYARNRFSGTLFMSHFV